MTRVTCPPSQRGVGNVQIPAKVARVIPPDAMFEVELVEDGILLRFVGLVPRGVPKETPEPNVPAWAKNGKV